MAYRPPAAPEDENGKVDFKELLMIVIVPKIVWLGCSITTIALLFAYLNYQGWQTILSVGSVVAAAGSAILLIGLITGTKRINSVLPALYRSVPILIIALYCMMVKK